MGLLNQNKLVGIILALCAVYILGFIIKAGIFITLNFLLAMAIAAFAGVLVATKVQKKSFLVALLSVLLFFFLSFGDLMLSQIISPCEEFGCTFVMVAWAFFTAVVSIILFIAFILASKKLEAKNTLFSPKALRIVKIINVILIIIFLYFVLNMSGVWKPIILSTAKAINMPSLCMSSLYSGSSAAKILCVGEVGAANKGSDAAFNILISNINNEDWEIRYKAMQALGRIGDERAIPYLEEALNDKEDINRMRAAASLKQITGQEYPYKTEECPLQCKDSCSNNDVQKDEYYCETGVCCIPFCAGECKESCDHYAREYEKTEYYCGQGICCITLPIGHGDCKMNLMNGECAKECGPNQILKEDYYCKTGVCCVWQG